MWASDCSFQKFQLLDPFFEYHGVQKLSLSFIIHFSACGVSLLLFLSSRPISRAVQLIVGLPFAEPSPLCCSLCAGGNGEQPWSSLVNNGAVKATERGAQEFDRLKQCWGKSLPKDCFSSQFTDHSRRRMRRRRGSENTKVAASGSLMKE